MRHNPDGRTKLAWCIYNLGEFIQDFKHSVKSPQIVLKDGSAWCFSLQPRSMNERDEF